MEKLELDQGTGMGIGSRRIVTVVVKHLIPEQNSLHLLFVVGYEKRDHNAQNAIFGYFSTYHHSKAIRVPGFPLGL